jgi:hypothetical protein
MGMVKPWFGKSKKFYIKKKAKALKTIAKQNAIVKICDEAIEKK